MLVSHNTFTYKKPTKWWMYPFIPFSKCQRKKLTDQIGLGVQVADIRVKCVKHKFWMVSHGLVTYGKLTSILKELEIAGISKVRLLIEGKYEDGDLIFLEYIMKVNFPNITFYEGRNKKTWKQEFNLPALQVDQRVGSMQSWYGKIIPALYHIIHYIDSIPDRIEAMSSEEYVSYDFI